MVHNYEEGGNHLKINDISCSLMAISTKVMVIHMKINGLTHKTNNFKKRNVMDDFNRILNINGISKSF